MPLIFRYVFYLMSLGLAFFLLHSCAQPVPLEGGPKDETPPKILSSSPENFSTRFAEDRIVLVFDEYIDVKSLEQDALISPPLKYPLEHKIKGRQLTIYIEDTLAANTTYIFNWGNAIVDFNEGNVLDSSLYVFSTGDKIDSLEIKGKLTGARDLAPSAEYLVMLYKTDEDSLPYKKRPYFLTKSDEQGEFNFKYLPPGEFKIFALRDEDRSFTYNPYVEEIGFLDSMVVSGSEDYYEIKTFKEHNPKLRMKDFEEVHYGHAYISFSNPVDSFALVPINDTEELPFVFEWSEDRDSVNLWLVNDSLYDTLDYEMYADTLFDTLKMRFKPREKFVDKKSKESSVKFSLKADISGKLNFFDTLFFRTNHPIAELKKEGWLFSEGEDTLSFDSLLDSGKLTLGRDTAKAQKYFYLSYDWKQNTPYKILITDSSVIDMFGLSHDTLITDFSTTEEGDYGEFKIDLDFPPAEGQYILYLMTEGDEVLKQRRVQAKETVVFKREKPGKYKLRMLDDRNKNGVWDPGIYLKGLQPEVILQHPEVQEMRENWDLEVEWIYLDQIVQHEPEGEEPEQEGTPVQEE